MAYSPSEKYPGAVDTDPDYQGGKFRDNNPSTTNNGSPLKAIDRNELLARDEAIMNDAGFEYNGLPDTPQDSQLFKAYKASLGNGANLLSNHNFLIQTPDDSQPLPSSTPTSYPPGYQIFSGVFANETTGITNLTYIDGRVSFSGGDLYFAVTNAGGVERLTDFAASVADFDGKPRTRGVSFALVGDEYRVTVGIDALEDASENPTPLGSVKFEQGNTATKHDLSKPKKDLELASGEFPEFFNGVVVPDSKVISINGKLYSTPWNSQGKALIAVSTVDGVNVDATVSDLSVIRLKRIRLPRSMSISVDDIIESPIFLDGEVLTGDGYAWRVDDENTSTQCNYVGDVVSLNFTAHAKEFSLTGLGDTGGQTAINQLEIAKFCTVKSVSLAEFEVGLKATGGGGYAHYDDVRLYRGGTAILLDPTNGQLVNQNMSNIYINEFEYGLKMTGTGLAASTSVDTMTIERTKYGIVFDNDVSSADPGTDRGQVFKNVYTGDRSWQPLEVKNGKLVIMGRTMGDGGHPSFQPPGFDPTVTETWHTMIRGNGKLEVHDTFYYANIYGGTGYSSTVNDWVKGASVIIEAGGEYKAINCTNRNFFPISSTSESISSDSTPVYDYTDGGCNGYLAYTGNIHVAQYHGVNNPLTGWFAFRAFPVAGTLTRVNITIPYEIPVNMVGNDWYLVVITDNPVNMIETLAYVDNTNVAWDETRPAFTDGGVLNSNYRTFTPGPYSGYPKWDWMPVNVTSNTGTIGIAVKAADASQASMNVYGVHLVHKDDFLKMGRFQNK